jgi:hypothetical protein
MAAVGNFVPETCARQREHARHTFYHKAKRARRDPSHGFIAKVRVAGSSPVVRSEALLRGYLRSPWTPVEHHLEKVRVATQAEMCRPRNRWLKQIWGLGRARSLALGSTNGVDMGAIVPDSANEGRVHGWVGDRLNTTVGPATP